MNPTELKEFDVVRVARSDGSDTGPGYWPVTAPSATTATKKTKDAAAEKTPRTKPQMIRLAEDDPRFTEWKVKLGILLKQELCPNPDVNFPRGYWLYEKSKHLWVSGYPIKVKLFKSPQEFAVHLIWLLSTSMDYRDCCCAHCNGFNSIKGGIGADDALIITHEPIKADKIPPKVTPVPLPPMPGQASQKPNQVTPRSQSTQSTPATTAQNSPAPTPQQPPQIQQPQPQAQQQIQQQAPPLTQAQPPPVQWSLKSPVLFRSGELVWYLNGNAWRLGVIASSTASHHEVMPIGHGIVQQNNVNKTEGEMRPFYAFTVPPVNLPELKDKEYDGVSWEALFQSTADGNRREMIALDASKMAAVKIDYSYSLWSKISEEPNFKRVAYWGCFFGAERIEIGDAMRLRSIPAELNVAAETCVLGLRRIFTTSDFPGAVFFVGHIYQLVSEDQSNIVRDEHLPIALRNESQWRHSVGAQRWRYALIKENVVFKEQSIRGRFYPTHRLMPILNSNEFQNSIIQRRVDEQHAHLNNRMDGVGRYLGRKINRLDTLGASVTHTARISLEPFIKEGDQPLE
ncbi:Cryptic loci regulator 2, C-terminal [Fusarium oxysporum f. sp. vasinfectum]|nr:Cryptic loci regulator 2, C-terminal [Fusarium oxysporum f. sp. vasinfectum]